MLGRKSKCYIRKFIPNTFYLYANLPVGQATKSPPLGPKLGQYGLNAESLCDEFNKSSLAIWKSGLKIPTVIMVTPSKTFVLENQFPSVYSLINTIFDVGTKQKTGKKLPKAKRVLLLIIYKIALIKSQTLRNNILMRWVFQVSGSLRSYQYMIIP